LQALVNWTGWFGVPTEPVLGFDPRKGSTDPAKIATALGTRPNGFHDSTREIVETQSGAQLATDSDNKPYLAVPCRSCGQLGASGEMHLGHVMKWEAYARQFKPQSTGAVWALFNDARNLRLEHQVCNVSHLFEELPTSLLVTLQTRGVADLTTTDRQRLEEALKGSTVFAGTLADFMAKLPNAADVFRELAQRHIPDDLPDTAGEFVLENDDGDQVFVIPDIHRMPQQKVVLLEDYERPKWDESTYHALFAIWKASGWVGSQDGVEFLRCGACRNFGEAHSMQIGHIVTWERYLVERNVARTSPADGKVYIDTRAAFFAYSDLQNLRYEHQSCNVSHDWETAADDAEDDEADTDDWSTFIDPDAGPVPWLSETARVLAHASADAAVAILNLQRDCDRAQVWLAAVAAGLVGKNYPGEQAILDWLTEKVDRLNQLVDEALKMRALMTECVLKDDPDNAQLFSGLVHRAERDGKELSRDVEGFHERRHGGVVSSGKRARENRKLMSMRQRDFLKYLGPSTSIDDVLKVVDRARIEEEKMAILRGI
jgi:hypothetical protein